MSAKRYFAVEFFLLCILIALCVSICKKQEKNTEMSVSGTVKKVCYLTFDDGPSKHSNQIMDLLKQYDAKATFFIIGSEWSEEKQKILDRMQKEGHAIGLHSNIHDFNQLYGNIEACVQDFNCKNTLRMTKNKKMKKTEKT